MTGLPLEDDLQETKPSQTSSEMIVYFIVYFIRALKRAAESLAHSASFKHTDNTSSHFPGTLIPL